MIVIKRKWVIYLINILIPLAVGGLSALFAGGADAFQNFNPPPLTPPAIVFPIVWSILYTLMGISMALVITSSASPMQKEKCIKIYALQLFVNFFWSIIFFRFQAYFLAFLWILLLLWLIVKMIKEFYKASPLAAKLQIPYLIWVSFATYLTFATYILSR